MSSPILKSFTFVSCLTWIHSKIHPRLIAIGDRLLVGGIGTQRGGSENLLHLRRDRQIRELLSALRLSFRVLRDAPSRRASVPVGRSSIHAR